MQINNNEMPEEWKLTILNLRRNFNLMNWLR